MKSIKILLLAFALLLVSNTSVFALVPADDDTSVDGSTTTPTGDESGAPADDDTSVDGSTTTPTGDGSETPGEDDSNGDEVIATSTPTTTPEVTTPTRRTSGGGSRRITPAPTADTAGEVLGAFTGEESCSTMYLTTYMRQGMVNNVEEVKKLQTFLNEHMSAGLPVTGFFGPLTHQAVMNFQAKYAKEVLTPWGITAPTGYVFKTTRALINNFKCANSEVTPIIK